MKLFLARALLLGMTFNPAAGALLAQTPVRLGFGGGVTIPSGATSNGLNNGWHAIGLVELAPSASPLGVRLDLSYHRLGFEGGEGRTRIIEATLNLMYEFARSRDASIRPYLLAGGGIYGFNAGSSAGSSVSTTKPGIDAGGGVSFGAGSRVLFIEGRFQNVFVPNSDLRFLPITAGLRITM
jgi:hypothetical protein